MSKGMLKKIHECHLGIDKYRKRGKEVLYWPRINRDIEQMVKSCSSCIKYGNKLGHEALKPHELPLRAWQRGASDMFQYKSMDYLVITDYYSSFPEVLKMKNTSCKAVIDGIKSVFARHRTPDLLITDNGRQYSAIEFKQFSATFPLNNMGFVISDSISCFSYNRGC